MSKQSKYNFVPITSIRQHTICKSFVTINNKGCIIFNRACIEKYNLANKYVRFFVDINKNVLGWQIIKTMQNFKEMKSKKYRLIKLSSYHNATISIKHILQQLNIEGKKFQKLKINEYVDTIYNTIYYVTLK